MNHFEGIVKTLLEHEGYWVRHSFKVNLTREEKRATGKHSIPRPEIDLLALKPGNKEVLALEVKSYFDSPGVKFADLDVEYEIATGVYKLFTCTKYRRIVFKRLKQDLVDIGMATPDVSIRLGLAAGNVYQNNSEEIKALFSKKGWEFISPEDIRDRVSDLASIAYENDPSVITAKILLRRGTE